MSTLRTPRSVGARRLAAVLLAIFLASCGGGGGGGGGDAAPPSPPPPPPPPPENPPPLGPLDFDSRTATPAAYLALAATGELLDWTEAFVGVVETYGASGPRQIALDCPSSGQRSAALADHDGTGAVSAGDEIVMTLLQCDHRQGEVTLRVDEIEAQPVGIVRLTGTVDYAIELDLLNGDVVDQLVGTHEIEVTRTSAESSWRVFDGEFSVLGWHVFPPPHDDVVFPQPSVPVTEDGEELVTEDIEQLAETYSNVTLSRRIDENGIYSVQLAGAVDSPFYDGTFQFSTPVAFTGDDGNYPVQGRLRLSSERGEIRVEPSTDPWEMVQFATYCCIDVDGDGTIDPPTPYEWLTFRGDRLFGVVNESSVISTPAGNRQPHFTSLTLTPENADTDDDIVVAASATDPDGDAVALQYQWRRNGWVVRGQSGPVFPAAEQSRGDVIVATVRVTDGELASIEHRFVVVQDSPPRLSLPSMLPTVELGEAITFRAAVVDSDGDPFVQPRFVLDYGPASMSLDAETGALEWTADAPMFGQEATFHWRISTTDAAIPAREGVFTVRDAGLHYPLMRTRIVAPTGRAALEIGDFDADGAPEILVLASRALYELRWNGLDYVQTWVQPFGFTEPNGTSERPHAMTAADVDGDGHAEIFFGLDSRVVKLSGTDRSVALAVTPESVSGSATAVYCTSDMDIADVDGDGALELVCSSENRIAVLSAATLEVEWATPQGQYGQALVVGNVDADPALEIVTSAGFVFDGASFVTQWVFGDGRGSEVGIGDVDGDGRGDIVVADFSDQAVRGYDAVSRTERWSVQVPATGTLFVGDLDGDDTAEIVVGSEGDELAIYAYAAGTNDLALIDSLVVGTATSKTSIAFGDPDGDGANELVFGAGMFDPPELLVVARAAPDLAIEWTNAEDIASEGDVYGAQLARLAQGREELVHGAGSQLRALDLASGQVTRGAVGARGRFLAVGDYDGDGIDEALVASPPEYRIVDVASGTAEAVIAASYDDVIAGAAGNLVGDERPEFALVTDNGGTVAVLDGLSQSIAAQKKLPAFGRDVAIADLDGDGANELIVATNLAVHVLAVGAGGLIETAAYAFDTQVVDLAVGDTTGDGVPEIYVLTDFPVPDRIHYLDAHLSLRGIFELETPATSVLIEELGSSRRNLAVCMAEAPQLAGYLSILDADSGALITRSPLLNGCAQPNSLDYFEDDSGASQIAFGTPIGVIATR